MPTDDKTFKDKLLNVPATQAPDASAVLRFTNFLINIESGIKQLEEGINTNGPEVESNVLKLINTTFKKQNIKEEIITENDVKELTNDKNFKKDTEKKANQTNLDICDKIHIFKNKMVEKIKKTMDSFGSILNGQYFNKAYNAISKFFKGTKNNIKKFFKDKLGSLLDWVTTKSKPIIIFLGKVISPITSIISWLATGAMNVIENLYEKFITLSHIGWTAISSVWNVFSEKASMVAEFFRDSFMEILSSPLGFTLAVIGFAIAIKYVIIPAIKFITEVAVIIWDWMIKQVDKIFFSSDSKKREAFFDSVSKVIGDFFVSAGNFIIKLFDSTIGKLFDTNTEKIKLWFVRPSGIIVQFWDKVVKIFDDITNSAIFDDIKFVWGGLKKLWWAINSVISDKPYELVKAKAMLETENEERLETLKTDKLKDLANSYIYENLYEYYFRNKATASDIEGALQTKATDLFENFKKTIKITTDEKANKKMADSISVNLNGIVTDIISKNDVQMNKVMDENKIKTLAATETLSEINKYFDDSELLKDVDEVHNTINKLVDDTFKTDILNKLKNSQDQEQKLRNGQINKINTSSKDIVENMNQLGIKFKDFQTSQNLIQQNSDTLIKAFNNLTTLIEKRENKKTIEARRGYDLKLFKEKQKLEEKQKQEAQIKDMANRYQGFGYRQYKDGGITQISNSKFTSETFALKDQGVIAKHPTKVLIAEAGSPELIVPINKEGIDFINESITSVLIDALYSDKDETKEDTPKNTIIQRIKKMQPKPDFKIYDMKNISQGVMGVCR